MKSLNKIRTLALSILFISITAYASKDVTFSGKLISTNLTNLAYNANNVGF